MKKNYLIIVLLAFLGYGLKAQTTPSNFINYQGVARNANGELLVESPINLGISLRFGAENALVAYQETHNLLTDANGVFSLRIGNGTGTVGDYGTLPWGTAAAFISATINGASVGTTEIMAVPYAISSGDGQQTAAEVPYDSSVSGLSAMNTQEAIDALANSGGSGTDDQNLELTGDVLRIEGGLGSVDLSTYRDDADADSANELQTLSFDAATNTLSLSDGNTVTIPSGGTDADADPMNEIQDISLDGTEISITSGSTIDLAPLIPPGGTDDQNLELTGDVLSIEGGLGSVDLSTYIDDADADANNEIQDISLDGTEISITSGSTIDLAPLIPPGGSDDQNLELTGDVLSIEGGLGSVDLSTYIDDADADANNEIQDISLDGTEISITSGSTIDLAPLIPPGGSDDQNLELTGDVLSIEGGLGSVDLSTYINDADFDPLNEVDVTTQTGILLGDGAGVTGLVGTTDGQVPKWDATTSAWVPGDDEVGTGGGAEELNDLSDAKKTESSLFIGESAGILINGNNITAIGQGALAADTSGELPGNNNTAIGRNALNNNIEGGSNTAIGNATLSTNLSGNRNSAVGSGALNANRLGSDNTALGSLALLNNTVNGNTAVGSAALRENTSGNNNTAVGNASLSENTTGEGNTAIGTSALRENRSSNNTAVGNEALQFNMNGNSNTAVGANSLSDNTTGASNTAVGVFSLGSNTSGGGNTAIGLQSLLRNVEGSFNTAVGIRSLRENITGEDNTAIGTQSLNSNTTGEDNTAVGVSSLGGNRTGRSNTAFGVRALRTTTGNNNTALGTEALENSTVSNLTAAGYQALRDNTTGEENTAVGYLTLGENTTGSVNTAMGFNALGKNTTGDNNSAFGVDALVNNSTGNNNTAFGVRALSQSNADRNTAVGASALGANSSGIENTAVGYDALLGNTGGIRNTAIGGAALVNNTAGSNNVAIGRSALFENTDGRNNTAVGLAALLRNIIGNDNTAVGFNALVNLTSGNNNTALGENAQVPNSTGSNQVRIGNTQIALAQIQVPWTFTSDRRWKTDIQDLPYGLNLVNRLRPVDYLRKNNEHQTRETGFIAQEVEAVLKQLGYKDQGILTIDDQGYMSLRYNDFIPILTKAIQEQQSQIEGLKKTNKNMQAQLDSLQHMVNTLWHRQTKKDEQRLKTR